LQGKSMQEFLRSELERIAARPSIEAWSATLRDRKQSTSRRVAPSKILRARDADRN
jgi:hypothetical protein